MIAVWPDERNCDNYHYEMPPEQGNLIHKLLSKMSVKEYLDKGFTHDEIEKLTSIYYSF